MSEYAEIETRSRVRRIKMGRLMRRIRSTGIHSMYAKRRKKKSRKEAIRITQVKSDEVLNECDGSMARPTAVPIATTQYCGSSAMHMMGFGWLLGACFGDTYSVDKSGDDGLEYKTCNTPKTAEMSSSDDDYDRDSDHVEEDDDDDDDDSSGGSTHPSASRVNQVLHLPAINMKEDNISDISSSSSEDSSWSSDYSDSDKSKSIQGVSDHKMKEGRRLHLILKRQR